jgi:predicted dehydrogenase
MTAYRLHFDARDDRGGRARARGRLGEPRLFDSTFSMQVEDRDNIRLRRDTGGGPLWDIGIYCVNAARCLFRAEPTEALSLAAPAPIRASTTSGGSGRDPALPRRPPGDRSAAASAPRTSSAIACRRARRPARRAAYEYAEG